MSFEYKPYVKLKSNVDINKLRYSLKIYNAVTQKIINGGWKIDSKKKYNLMKSGSNYRTDFIGLIYKNTQSEPVETIRNLVIIFDLYRVDDKGIEKHVIKNYYVNNLIEEFRKDKLDNVKLDIVVYMEKPNSTVEQKQSNKNIVDLKISTKRIFRCKEYSIDTPLDPFTKEAVEASLNNRLRNPYPDQRETYLCGPAAFFFCVLNSSKTVYKKIVKDLWEGGTASYNKLTIKSINSRLVSNYYNEKGEARISAVDWITMASLRDTTNGVTDYNKVTSNNMVGDAFNGFTAFTMPNEVYDWFVKFGYQVPLYESSIGKALPKSVNWLSILKKLSNYPSKDYYYVLLTTGAILKSGPSLPKISIPTHYIVINSDLSTSKGLINNNTSDNEIIHALSFSWGKVEPIKEVTLKELCKFIWAIIVVKRELI